MQAGSITDIAFPAGESVSRPGWDGQLLSKDGEALGKSAQAYRRRRKSSNRY